MDRESELPVRDIVMNHNIRHERPAEDAGVVARIRETIRVCISARIARLDITSQCQEADDNTVGEGEPEGGESGKRGRGDTGVESKATAT